MNRSKTSYPTLSLGPLLLLHLKILYKKFHLFTLLTLYGKLQWKRNLIHYLKTILQIWWLSL